MGKMVVRQVFHIANLFYNPNWPLQSEVLQVSDEKLAQTGIWLSLF